MDKVLVIIPDNNKGKFISKGFSSAFKDFSYFVIEKKIFDLNIDEINHISPDIVFTFWSDIKQSNDLIVFFEKFKNSSSTLINLSEKLSDIPAEIQRREDSFSFSYDNKKKKFRVLPSVSPKEYKRKYTGYRYLITFSGNPAYENREKLLAKLIYNFGIINIFCRSYDFYKSVDDMYRNNLLDEKYIHLYRDSYRGYVESQKELSYIYSNSKVNIDLSNDDSNYVNYRCMEILASGGFLISPYSDLLIKTFDDGKEIETYKNDTELVDKINFYLNNSNLAQLIASKGKKNVVSNHSFYDRLKVMLKEIYGKDSRNR